MQFRRFSRVCLDLPDEILNVPDPLAALIAANEYSGRENDAEK